MAWQWSRRSVQFPVLFQAEPVRPVADRVDAPRKDRPPARARVPVRYRRPAESWLESHLFVWLIFAAPVRRPQSVRAFHRPRPVPHLRPPRDPCRSSSQPVCIHLNYVQSRLPYFPYQPAAAEHQVVWLNHQSADPSSVHRADRGCALYQAVPARPPT